jgi:hypothetical protein
VATGQAVPSSTTQICASGSLSSISQRAGGGWGWWRQVHRAKIGDQMVVVKVQRPGLKELFDIDLKNIRVRPTPPPVARARV